MTLITTKAFLVLDIAVDTWEVDGLQKWAADCYEISPFDSYTKANFYGAFALCPLSATHLYQNAELSWTDTDYEIFKHPVTSQKKHHLKLIPVAFLPPKSFKEKNCVVKQWHKFGLDTIWPALMWYGLASLMPAPSINHSAHKKDNSTGILTRWSDAGVPCCGLCIPR